MSELPSYELCTIQVDRSANSRWSSFEPCGRKAVENGLCSLHAKVLARRIARTKEMTENFARGADLQAEAQRLSVALGISVVATYDPYAKGGGAYTGSFTVPGDWLRAKAEKETP